MVDSAATDTQAKFFRKKISLTSPFKGASVTKTVIFAPASPAEMLRAAGRMGLGGFLCENSHWKPDNCSAVIRDVPAQTDLRNSYIRLVFVPDGTMIS